MSVEKKVKITNETGLHARPASKFVQKAGGFNSEIIAILNDREVNAKSILGILSLGASKGKEIILKAEGTDEEMAIKELVNYLEVELPKEE
ncbi:HPr family phosphocarrier protein [Iocasia frigidifontis]|uniref:Phosphocarrier protein HPr n=1 Tax=Iocasia fonsfrigidae TaxID=2682810 RepID=A0A8A7KDZ1_9FIRM|nr:HPr family phosphocarrier protein [Iocasia fonsfrigidae]QTL97649.1 HPr family phosphocarrier protein [Iocasia fonsfrigidae]